MGRPAKPALSLLPEPHDECADGLLSLQAAAEFFDCSEREVYRLIATRQLEVVRLGRRLKVLRSQCVALVERRLAESRRRRN